MGPMTPAAYDHWWRSRIVKEETDYANHIQHNWLQAGVQGSQQQKLTLSSIGAPQLVNNNNNAINNNRACQPVSAVLAQQQQHPVPQITTLGDKARDSSSKSTGTMDQKHATNKAVPSPAGSNINKHGNGPASHVSAAAATAPQPHSRNGSLVAARSSVSAAASKTAAAKAPSEAGSSLRRHAQQRPGSCLSGACSVVSQATRLTAQRGAARSDVSYPQTPNFSQAGSSVAASEIMSRLARLEADLAAERSKREAAEAEMRQLMASRGGSRPGTGHC